MNISISFENLNSKDKEDLMADFDHANLDWDSPEDYTVTIYSLTVWDLGWLNKHYSHIFP